MNERVFVSQKENQKMKKESFLFKLVLDFDLLILEYLY